MHRSNALTLFNVAPFVLVLSKRFRNAFPCLGWKLLLARREAVLNGNPATKVEFTEFQYIAPMSRVEVQLCGFCLDF